MRYTAQDQAWTVTDAEGRDIRPGDAVRSFRGEVRQFVAVERGPSDGSAKIITVDATGFSRGSYAAAFNLTVSPRSSPRTAGQA